MHRSINCEQQSVRKGQKPEQKQEGVIKKARDKSHFSSQLEVKSLEVDATTCMKWSDMFHFVSASGRSTATASVKDKVENAAKTQGEGDDGTSQPCCRQDQAPNTMPAVRMGQVGHLAGLIAHDNTQLQLASLYVFLQQLLAQLTYPTVTVIGVEKHESLCVLSYYGLADILTSARISTLTMASLFVYLKSTYTERCRSAKKKPAPPNAQSQTI